MVVTLHQEAVLFVSRTGRVLTLRPCTPEDAPLIADLYRRVSDRALHLRFCSSALSISPEGEAARLCGGNPEEQAVFLAVDGGEVVGIGEVVREDEETGEIAFLVRDDCQSEGIGTALAERLVEAAREMGFARLRAYLLYENHGMRRLLAKLPFPRTAEGSWGELCVTLEIGCTAAAHR